MTAISPNLTVEKNAGQVTVSISTILIDGDRYQGFSVKEFTESKAKKLFWETWKAVSIELFGRNIKLLFQGKEKRYAYCK